jgi:uncharacterized repeat protein (TIGR03803 family)
MKKVLRMLGCWALSLGCPGTIQLVAAGSFQVLHQFSHLGELPQTSLIRDVNGNLYGTTSQGGPGQGGTIFKIDGANQETILYSFTGGADGSDPSGVIMDASGNLYGTTPSGGAGWGTVFKLDTANTLTTLYSFANGTDGANPAASLIMDASGNLFGTTSSGGAGGSGTIFKLNTSNSLTTLYSFGGSDGSTPLAPLLMDSLGNLYGTTSGGGPNIFGTVFRLDTANTLTILHSFNGGGAEGGDPRSGLIMDPAGNLYGTTSTGIFFGQGTVFKLDTTNTLTTLHYFTGGADGADPRAGVIMDPSGNLYGTTSAGGSAGGYGTVFELDSTNTLTTLHTFTGGLDGGNSYAAVIIDPSGNLYGTTLIGGVLGQGTVFSLDSAGTLTTLYSFLGLFDGGYSYAPLIIDPAGSLIGTTSVGGEGLYGTVFRLDSSNTFTTLHSFDGNDGGNPYAPVIRDSVGNLYGTTIGPLNGAYGTIFLLDTSNTLTTLYGFTGGVDGAYPKCALVRDSLGNLFGTTSQGGSLGYGTVFKLDTANMLTTLHDFTNGVDGGGPGGSLVMDSAGNLYGTTFSGGAGGAGTVFKLDSSNTLTTLYPFSGGADGGGPAAPLLRDSSGTLYGIATLGGAVGWGTVFKLDTSNTLTTLHSFTAGADGASPNAPLIMDSSGDLYGTTESAGAWGGGTVFRLDPSNTLTTLYSFTSGDDGGRPFASLVMDSAENLFGTTSSGSGASVAGTVFEIVGGACPTVGPAFLAAGTVSAAYQQTVFALGGASPYSFAVASGALPPGLSLDSASGTIAGTPTAAGVYGFGISVGDAKGCSVEEPYTVVVNPAGCAGIVVSPSILPDGQEGIGYGETIAGNDGAPPYTYSLGGGALPPGLTLDSVTGAIGGVPTAAGSYAFTVIAYDANSCAGSRALSINVAAAGATTLASIQPDCGSSSGGETITLTGANFQPGVLMRIAGRWATGVSVVSPTQITAVTPGNAAGTVGDVVLLNANGTTTILDHGFAYDFLDTASTSPFHPFVCAAERNLISSGCGGGEFCPGAAVLRSQMAVFILRGAHGGAFVPPPCNGIFADVQCPGAFTNWIEELFKEGISGGCSTNPLEYCPGSAVNRAEMAVFLLEAEHGAGYAPPGCSGIFADVACPGAFTNFIEELYNEGITGGCSANPLMYCPANPVTRGQMAVFLTVTFGLQ